MSPGTYGVQCSQERVLCGFLTAKLGIGLLIVKPEGSQAASQSVSLPVSLTCAWCCIIHQPGSWAFHKWERAVLDWVMWWTEKLFYFFFMLHVILIVQCRYFVVSAFTSNNAGKSVLTHFLMNLSISVQSRASKLLVLHNPSIYRVCI